MKEEEYENYEKIDGKTLQDYHKCLKKQRIPVMRINKNGNWSIVPDGDLGFLTGNKLSSMYFYIRKGWREEIKEDETTPKQITETKGDSYSQTLHSQKREETLKEITISERVAILRNNNEALKKIYLQDTTITSKEASIISNATSDAHISSKASMLESLEKIENEKISEEGAVSAFSEISDAVEELALNVNKIMNKHPETHKVLGDLMIESDGRTYYHCSRVFMEFINFINFYNNLINSSLPARLRGNFDKYLSFYERLNICPPVRKLEDVFAHGMSRLDGEELLFASVGTLIHDIGKLDDLDYYEGEKARDFSKIPKHAYYGYHLVVTTSDFPPSVALMCGSHHEYYGHKDGYGVCRELSSLGEKRKPHENAISYLVSEAESGRSIAFFPSKVLEILDVYDALIMPTRLGKQSTLTNEEEVLRFMRTHFLEKEVKLDPILFDIFVEYLSKKEGKKFEEALYRAKK